MRLLFSSLLAYGHTYPLLPFAVAARDAGHEVTFATGAEFHPTLEALGFEAVPAGKSMPEAIAEAFAEQGIAASDGFEGASQEQRDRAIATMFFSALPRRFAEDIGNLLTRPRGFDLVVHEAANVGAGLAAKVAGIPGVCHGFGRSGHGFDPIGFRKLSEFAAELGVDVGVDVPDDTIGSLGNPYLDIYPPSLQEPTFREGTPNRVEMRPVPFSQPGELPPMVTEPDARPLVFLTLGTAFGTADVLRETLSALAELEVRVLVAAAQVEVAELGELPPNVLVVPWVPQAELFEYADLVVQHGGSGTTLGAAAAGLPQLMLPQGADQFDNAAAVSAAGAGRQLLPGDFSREAVRDAARELLDGDRTAVHALAKEIAAMPPPAEIVRRVPEFAR